MKETTPSDRVQLIDRGSLMHPGCCALCGSGNCDEGYVDTGVWYDYEGQVYFCWNCAMQIAAVIGCLSADEHTHLRELLEKVTQRANAAEKELTDANERLNDYDNLMLRALSGSPDGVVLPSADAPTDESQAEPAEPVVTNEPPVGTDEGSPKPKESVKGSGRRVTARTERSDSSTTDAGISI